MKKLLLLTSTLVALAAVVDIAQAQSSPWSGYYVGVDAGLSFDQLQLQSQQLGFTDASETCNASTHQANFLPGLQVGYLYPVSNTWLAGIEANLTLNSEQTTHLGCNSAINAAVYDGFSFNHQLQTLFKGRFGQLLNWQHTELFPYVMTGVGITGVGLKYYNEGGDYYAKHDWQSGWLIGFGGEWYFNPQWSLRAEYYYIDYGNAINLKIPTVYGLNDSNGKASMRLKANNVRLGLNYWF